MTNTVLVTGAEGFTGRYLVTELQQAGYRVAGLTRTAVPAIAGLNSAHAGDLGQLADLQRVIDAVRPDFVVHLAAIAFVAHGDVDAIYQTNLLGSRNLLEALSRGSHRPHAVLLASSANIYGNSVGGALTETTPAAPANDYAVSKLAMEYMAGLYAARLPIVIARPFNYTGVGQGESFLLPKVISHARKRAAVIELGNIDVERDFSDVRTVVQYYRRLLEAPAAVGQTFNVCSGRAYTLRQVLEMVESLSGNTMQIVINPAFVRANEVKTLMGDRSRLDAVVGQIAAPSLSDTLRWMLEA